MEMKLELIPVPVTDVDRAKDFYTHQVGFKADHDHKVQPGLRFVQLTPPGSACSIVIGESVTEMKPGSQKNLQMVVKDVRALRKLLLSHDVRVSEIQEMPWGIFAYFSDPDGNSWALQEIVRS